MHASIDIQCTVYMYVYDCVHVLFPHLLLVAVGVTVIALCNACIFFFIVLYVPIQHTVTNPSSTTSMTTDVMSAIIDSGMLF